MDEKTRTIYTLTVTRLLLHRISHNKKTGKRRRKKGFGFLSQEHSVRPGNCSVGRLMCDRRFTEAVLTFLRDTQVGVIKKGVLVRGEVTR